MKVAPFRVEVPETAVEDLRTRLARTRWPEEDDDAAGSLGLPRGVLTELVEYWRTRFDWRRVEARINALENSIAEIDGERIHFVRWRGAGSSLPIILTHGWPGSFLEMLELAPRLADPAAHGGESADAFDVVVPSLPGYGFSSRPRETGMHPRRIAQLWGALMSGLGHERFGAQGGDWGASVSTWLSRDAPERVIGLHLNYIPGSFAPDLGPGSVPLAPEEEAFVAQRQRWREEEGAYGQVQATRPRTLAYGLNDSPVGLAAWILEKFRTWSDCGGDLLSRFSADELLANVTLYWLTGTIGSSVRLYAEAGAVPLRFGPGERVRVPCGIARLPLEIPMPPRAWVERVYDVVRWTELPRGGHFAAMEEPELLARDIRNFFRPLRDAAAGA